MSAAQLSAKPLGHHHHCNIFHFHQKCYAIRKLTSAGKLGASSDITSYRNTMTPSIELHFVYTRDDYIHAFRAYEARMPRRSLDITRTLISIGLDILFLAAALYVALAWQIWWSLLFVLCLIGVSLLRFFRRRYWISTDEFDHEAKWQGDRVWQISDEGMNFESHQMNSQVKDWAMIALILDCPSCYIFSYKPYYSETWFFLPKRLFSSAEQEELFRSIVSKHVPIK
jgi:hypothetical protein